ncbi:MAG: hypothetical protein P8Y98_00280 [Anaerolineales bacterium]
MKDTFVLSGLCIFISLLMLSPLLVIGFLLLRKKRLINVKFPRGGNLKRLFLILGMIVLGIGVFAVVAEYLQDASTFRKGLQACQSGNFLTAVDDYDGIIYTSRFTDIGNFVNKAMEEKVSCFEQMAASSKQDGDLGMALVAYLGLIGTSDDEAIIESSGSEIETILIENDPADLANLELCDSIELLSEGQWVPQPATRLPPVYLACGQVYLQEGEDYQSAIETYQFVMDRYPYSEEASLAADELESTIYASSLDTGEYGKSLIRESWEAVCNGKPAISPAVGLSDREFGKLWFGGSEFELPSDMQAASPGEFQYAICVERGVEIIETCIYAGGTSVSRGRHWLKVSIRDVLTAEIVKTRTFSGSDPRGCPQSISQGYNLNGSRPSDSLAFDWVMENLRGIVR